MNLSSTNRVGQEVFGLRRTETHKHLVAKSPVAVWSRVTLHAAGMPLEQSQVLHLRCFVGQLWGCGYFASGLVVTQRPFPDCGLKGLNGVSSLRGTPGCNVSSLGMSGLNGSL